MGLLYFAVTGFFSPLAPSPVLPAKIIYKSRVSNAAVLTRALRSPALSYQSGFRFRMKIYQRPSAVGPWFGKRTRKEQQQKDKKTNFIRDARRRRI